MSVKVVTDTSCDLPAGLEQEFDITAVPLIFIFGDEQFKDKTIPMAEFWEKAQTVWPKTAAPSSGDFERTFRQAVDAGHQVICIAVTSKLSATYNAALVASQRFTPDQVAVIDSTTLAISQGHLVLAAAQAARAGQSLSEVVRTVEVYQDRLHLYISLDTVQYLVKGGRASRLSGILAGLLKIRPLLDVEDGELVLLEKLRGRQLAKQRLLEIARKHLPAEKIAIAHVACLDGARELAASLAVETGFPVESIPIIEVGMALATHGGPGTLGIGIVEA
ncbi:MAG: DegV family protein [Anaerolineae bacterium]